MYRPLADAACNRYSQFGEDGIVSAVFDRIGTRNRWCFEVGAHDGNYLSNTKQFRDQGWSAVLIETDPRLFADLRKLASDTVHCVHRHIVPGDLDRILAQCDAPRDIDFGVIDIDSDDYWVFDAMAEYLPRVAIVEFGYDPDYMPPEPNGKQAGRKAIIELARRKGYTCVVTTHVNAVLVKDSDLWTAHNH